eukprot:gb/GECG01009142.1/.p1 GENE.gb/GECG01009142.1/~~gb/GECG01009142.1/.p1  ORF type:complete len:1045 (+),score=110.83 gb/GECG01009142.1/:1-3135(+)
MRPHSLRDAASGGFHMRVFGYITGSRRKRVSQWLPAVFLSVLLATASVWNEGAGSIRVPTAAARSPTSSGRSSTTATGTPNPGSPRKHTHIPMSTIWEWREDVRDMFYHAFDAYMEHGFPWDELQPLTCKPRKWFMRERGTLDDTLGGYMLTLVDALDTLAVIGDYEEFSRAVSYVSEHLTFDRNVTVSTFEANIRVLGGLLSAHLLATNPEFSDLMPAYNGRLLTLAADLGERLLPAFDTPTGLPFHKVNLVSGVKGIRESASCTAAAGTFGVEFFILSKLTGDMRFISVAKHAMDFLWDKQSTIGLIGNSIDIRRGIWTQHHTGIGAGVDSYLEYTLKYYVLTGDTTYWSRFQNLSYAVHTHMDFADLHTEVSFTQGRKQPHTPYVSALQAFWPGIQVLGGNIALARKSFARLWSIWKKYEALPEIFDVSSQQPVSFAKDSPLRPELVESLYHLYTATRDQVYLEYARRLAIAMEKQSKVDCGYASVADVKTKRLDDRMDSYFFSETLKYLFLIFDSALQKSSKSSAMEWNVHVTASNKSSDCKTVSGVRKYEISALCSDPQLACGKTSWSSCDSEACLQQEKKECGFVAQSSQQRIDQPLREASRDSRCLRARLPIDYGQVLFSTEGHPFVIQENWTDKEHVSLGGECSVNNEITEDFKTLPGKSVIVGSADYQRYLRQFEQHLRKMEEESVTKLAKKVKEEISLAKKVAGSSNNSSEGDGNMQQLFISTFHREPASHQWHQAGGQVPQNAKIERLLENLSQENSPFPQLGINRLLVRCLSSSDACGFGMTPSSGKRVRLHLDGEERGFSLPLVGSGAVFGPMLSRKGLSRTPVALASPLDACSPNVSVLRHNDTGTSDPVIAVAIRGFCSFMDKVRNLNFLSGVVGVIIFDDPRYPNYETGIMGADNSDNNITVPSTLVTQAEPQYEAFLQLLGLKGQNDWTSFYVERARCCSQRHSIQPPKVFVSMADARLPDDQQVQAENVMTIAEWPSTPSFSVWPTNTGKILGEALQNGTMEQGIDWDIWWQQVFGLNGTMYITLT